MLEESQAKGESHVHRLTLCASAFLAPLPGGPDEKAKSRSGRRIVTLIAAGLAMTVLLALLAACSSESSQPTQAPQPATEPSAGTPAVDGATLLETRCSTCHSADRARSASKTRDQWEQTVSRMIEHGAQLTEEEKTVLVDFLAANYGP
jgi:cytochrome c5